MFHKLNKTSRLLAAAGLVATVSAHAAPAESDPVWRTQLEITVANVEDAGTDDPVFVQFGNGKRFIMNYGHDDFERGSRFTYDVMPGNVKTIGDIQSMRIFKERSNGLALQAVKLIVNGVPIFSHNYGASPLWLDSANRTSGFFPLPPQKIGSDHLSVEFGARALRNSPTWQAYRQPTPPFFISAAEIRSRIEGLVGNLTWGSKVGWGRLHGKAVEIERNKKDPSKIHVDLDLEAKVLGPNPEVDVDLDVQMTCHDGTLKLVASKPEVDVDIPWYGELLSLGFLTALESNLNHNINAQLKGMTRSVDLASNLRICPTISVAEDGSVFFSLPRPKPQAAAQPGSKG